MSRNNLNRKLKYSIRKKKNGGGAASFIVGSVVLGGLMLGGATTVNADEVTQSPTDTSAKSSGSTDISGTEVALSSPSNGKPAAPSNGKPAASTAATTESTADATTSAKNETQPTTSATSESTPEATTTPVITAGDATSEGNTDTSATTNGRNNAATAQPTTAEVEKKETLANNKIKVSNIRLNKSVVKESEGLDLDVSFDWTGTDLKKGDVFEVPMSAGFDSMNKVVTTSFGNSANPNMGILVLDYNQRKVFAEFTQDIDPNKIYSGTINVGTFVNRDYYKNYVNKTTIKIPKVDGSVEEIPLTVIFDETQKYPQLQIVSMSGEKMEDKSDGSSDVTWATVVNAEKKPMSDLDIYLSPDNIVQSNFPTFENYSQYKPYTDLNVDYDETNSYTIDTSTIKVYEANAYPSTGYEKGKQLVEGRDYKITTSPEFVNNKNAVLIQLQSSYTENMSTPLVVEWGGNIPNARADSTVDKVFASSFVAYHETPFDSGSYGDKLKTMYVNADTKLNQSSVTGVTEENNYKGSVTVMHIDGSTGNLLEKESYVKENAPIGESYTTSPKDFTGYKYVYMGTNSAPATGQVEANVQTVIYVYMPTEEKKGNVDVTYVAEDGTTLEATSDVVKDGKVGSTYETTEKTFDGYKFKRMGKFSADATGQVEEGTKHVVYVYAKTGNVDVKYVDTEGNVLPGGEVTPVKTNEEVGTEYGTSQKTFDGYHFVKMDVKSAPATGVVTAKDQHVIYVYEKDTTPVQPKGNVDVVYVAEDGKVLEPQSDVAKDAELGTVYSTEQKEFKGYTFSHMGQYSASPTGTVEEGTKHVIYVYSKNPELKKGSVDVKYIAKDGKVLEDVTSVKDNAPVGEDYTTEEKTFDGYHFVGMDKTSDPATGLVAEGTKHVIYVYEKDVTPEVKKGSVDVKYVTTDGKVLENVTKVKDNAPVGEAYTTEEKSFDGYHFVGMDKTSDSANGKVTEGDKHVVYVYEKDVTPEVKKGSVDVKYVTTDGKVLEDVTKVKDNAPVGEAYTTEEKSFDGYHFVGMDKTSDSANGKVTEGDKHVVYVYEKDVTPEVKKGSVDVKYVTTDGKVLENVTKVKDNAPVGEAYTTEEKSFDGYHFVGMDKTSDSANGKVTEGDKHVVYVYEKNPETPTPEVKKGSVDVKYVTTDGKVLEDVTKVKDNAPVGEAYTTEEKSFDGYHFVGMDKTSDSANGKVTEGDKHIVYVYEKDPEVPTTPVEKKGSVYVKYVDENGNELPGGEKTTVVKDGKVGSYYFTTEKDFDGYTFSHMAEGSSDPTGKVVEGDQQVVYVYTKNNTPQPEPNKPEVPTTPETPAVPQEEKTTTNTPVKTSTSKVSVEKVTVNKAAVLPQTGDKKENNSSVMGLVSLGLAGLLGLGIKRKEEKDNH